MATTEKKSTPSVGFPITFEQFAKKPAQGIMFLCLVSVGYLYIDLKLNYNKQIDNQGKKIEILERKIDTLTEQLRRSDSITAAATSKLNLLQQLGKIK